ncbi:hypothetical protein H0H93_009182 [Arthromyces matolae]|nr:hypothetical protein H0H93_009182 [Arthromyces matolae]
MSEFDALSDSDWLDIASNRESDDTDSVISADSHCSEDAGLIPLSRRSSMSIGSSREGEVDAWEGFLEESSEDEVQSIIPETVASPVTAVMIEYPMPWSNSDTTDGTAHDPFEEQRVNEALDQSMMSTLSASRSSATSTHASLRDLRLSFPDPLTSSTPSRNELNSSYEGVSLCDAMVDADLTTDGSSNINCTNVSLLPLSGEDTAEDPGALKSTPVVTGETFKEEQPLFEVVLYGSPSSIKWSFVLSLVEKAAGALVSDHGFVEVTFNADQATRCLQIRSEVDVNVNHVVSVYDRTDDVGNVPTSHALAKRPSLAIIYLPARVTITTDHSLYLPVLAPSYSPDDAISRHHLARRDWDFLSVPSDKVVQVGNDTESVIFDGGNAEIQVIRAHRLLDRLLAVAKRRPAKVLSDHIRPAQAVTLSTPPTPTMAATSPIAPYSGISSIVTNHTTSVLAPIASTETTMMTTEKEVSLSIFSPGTTSLSIIPDSTLNQAASSVPDTTGSASCKPSPWVAKLKSAKNIMIRPATSIVNEVEPSTTVIPLTGGGSGPSKTTALGLVVETLTEALDGHVARLRSEYRVDELLESLDDLTRAIHRQTVYRIDKGKGKAKEIKDTFSETLDAQVARLRNEYHVDDMVESLDEIGRELRRQAIYRVDKGKGKAKDIRDIVQYRHERARSKARDLKKKGEEIMYRASAEIKERTNNAKKKARDITDSLANSESIRSYQKLHEEWVAILKEKGGERPSKRSQKCGLFSRPWEFYRV